MTKNQKTRLGQLGAEWTVLDSEENMINRLIREHYRASRPRVEQVRGLKTLVREQRRLFKRKREISADIIAIESGATDTKPRPRGRRPDPYVLVRDALIREMKDCTNKEICRSLDARLDRGADVLPFGFPEGWKTRYSVRSFTQAYKHLECKKLVETLFCGFSPSFTQGFSASFTHPPVLLLGF